LQFRQQAVDLNSDNPSAIKLFVLAQAALIEKGHTQNQAYKIVEEEFSKAMTGWAASSFLQRMSIAKF